MNPNQFDQKRYYSILRKEAEARLASSPPPDIPEQSPETLLHELQVHRIELEMQNEELRRTQIALENSRDRYVDLYEFAPVGYLTLSDKGLITGINLTGAALLGSAATSRNSLLKQSISSLICKDDQDIFYLHRKKLLETGQPQDFDLCMKKHDGTQFWAHLTATSTREADGAPALRIVLNDISERKRAEERQLDSLLQLEEKELAKTRFLAAAGHDLRQPVAAANLFVEALKLTAPTPRQKELITRLDQSMGVFSGLLERLLDISKFDAGLIKPQIASFDLTELFDWLEQNFAGTTMDRKLNFRLCFPRQKTLIVRTDIFLLQSVLMNLVSNALKFTEAGGILISARTRGNKVILQVWDTGIGMKKAEIAHIFDEFYQIDNPQRSREAGLGLGLSICQRAMSLLGSQVTCRSRPGRGSVFEICLPLNEAPHEIEHLPISDTPVAAGSETLLRGKRLVVVENDALVAAGMLDLLQGAGAQVRIFYNAEEALRHDDLANTDFFIVDYALGGELTGLNFLLAAQQRQQEPIRAVVMTGETSSQFISSVAESPWPVLHKPVNYANLITSLRQ